VQHILIAAADVVADHQPRELQAIDQHDPRAEPARGVDRRLAECRGRDEDALVGLLQAQGAIEVADRAGPDVVA
jgi:hypothetical protein